MHEKSLTLTLFSKLCQWRSAETAENQANTRNRKTNRRRWRYYYFLYYVWIVSCKGTFSFPERKLYLKSYTKLRSGTFPKLILDTYLDAFYFFSFVCACLNGYVSSQVTEFVSPGARHRFGFRLFCESTTGFYSFHSPVLITMHAVLTSCLEFMTFNMKCLSQVITPR